jgi:hypothetical protein
MKTLRNGLLATLVAVGLHLAGFAGTGRTPEPAPTIEVTPGIPRILQLDPEPGATVGALTELEVLFDRSVTGVNASDLLANGTPALDATESSPGQYLFGFESLTPGNVVFTWAASHGIADAVDPGKTFEGGTWTITLDPALARRQVMISEFMADNDVALYDDDCDRSDWIEIHNAGSAPISLEGWFLTDDATVPDKWRFPAYTLEAESYLIVFASQKNKTNLPPRACRNRSNSLAGFHTNFRLSPEGEYLALIAPDGEVISAFAPAYPPQRRDVSYGRVPGSPELVGFLSRPTPRTANASRGDGFAPEVQFSKPSGPFLQPFLLALATPSANTVIRFTLDGSFPGETNARLLTYSGPIPITNTTQVRARAYQNGLLPGAPTSETFLRLTNDPAQLASLTSTLPIVVMTTLRAGNIGGSANTPVHFSLFEPRNGRTTLLDQPTLTTRGGAKTRGSSTGGQPQSNFGIEWWDEFNQDKDLPVLGMPEESEWVLYAPNEFDAALIHNPFTMELSRQMNFPAPRTRFVEVYLNKGGSVRSNDWFGLYVLMEKPGISKSRIDIPKAAPEDVEFPEITGSYMFKTDRLDPGDTGLNAGGALSAFVEPKEREMKSPQRARQLAYLTQFFRDLDASLRPTNPNLRDPVRGYRGHLNLTNWVDFHLLELLSGQVDAIRLSTYFYKPRNGKLTYGPRWDYDRAWESKGDSRDDNPRVWDSGGGLFAGPWWNRVLGDRDAWQLWIDRWTEYRKTVFSRDNMFRVIDAMTNEIRTAQPRENRRWPATAPRLNYPNEIRIMKSWISNRLAWIDSQFAQPPRFSSGDAQVDPGFLLSIDLPTSISNPSNVAIFYTLDGTDPRPVAGTSAPIAFRYSSPITITTNTRVTARVRDLGRIQRGPPSSSTWSAPVIATFLVQPLPLLVTEIHHHPEQPASGTSETEPNLQFLELMNAGERDIDLAGCQFVRGISFAFKTNQPGRRLAPGQRLILAAHPTDFALHHPEAQPVAGPFEGNLANEGERLTLIGPNGETILDFTYPAEDFPTTDGLGFSLVLADETTPTPASALSESTRWRASTFPGGSPGRADPPPGPPPPAVRVTEVLAASSNSNNDWVEVYNPEPRAADIGGWWLTDSFNRPKRARIPAGWTVPPRGFLVIPASVFDVPGPDGFAFSAEGDGVWLLSADADGTLTGWVHGFTFGASPPNTSFGRWITSTGQEHFVAQSKPSPGSLNSESPIGPLAFTEIALTRSSTGSGLGIQDAFIEILNLSAESVPLALPFNRSRSWQVDGTVSFSFADAFPTGLRLEPGARLVLVGFDPTLEPFALAAFRARYAMNHDTTIVGPWRGALNPSQTTLRLLPPSDDAGFSNTQALPVGAETLDLAPIPPWPVTGFAPGQSLSRRSNLSFAGDGAQWAATPPTPGEPDTDLDGLPDFWETLHGLHPASALGHDGADGNPDADRLSNLEEFRSRTDPTAPDAAGRLVVLPSGHGRIACLVSGRAGQPLVLEGTDANGPPHWQELRSDIIPAEGTWVFQLATRTPRAFLLRLRTP